MDYNSYLFDGSNTSGLFQLNGTENLPVPENEKQKKGNRRPQGDGVAAVSSMPWMQTN
ncbi:MAG: hypothetical protein GYA12_00895 [Chloroflexi bacterium]|nr:hypothetical protein [Chloroflexota bacterium]